MREANRVPAWAGARLQAMFDVAQASPCSDYRQDACASCKRLQAGSNSGIIDHKVCLLLVLVDAFTHPLARFTFSL